MEITLKVKLAKSVVLKVYRQRYPLAKPAVVIFGLFHRGFSPEAELYVFQTSWIVHLMT